MICPRCSGLMFANTVVSDGETESVTIWGCINCGEQLDDVILANREASRAVQDKRSRARWYKRTVRDGAKYHGSAEPMWEPERGG